MRKLRLCVGYKWPILVKAYMYGSKGEVKSKRCRMVLKTVGATKAQLDEGGALVRNVLYQKENLLKLRNVVNVNTRRLFTIIHVGENEDLNYW